MPASLLGLSSSYFAFRGKGIYDSVKAVFDLGFETVELGAAHSSEPNAWSAVRRIKRDFPEKNYTVHSLFPPLKERYWFNPSLGLTRKNRQVVESLFRAAGLVEAEVVGLHPGFLNELGFGYDRSRGFNVLVPGKLLDREKSWGNFGELMQHASGLARKTGIALAIENIHGHEARPLVLTAEEFERTFSMFPELRFLFDYGHALFEGNAKELIERFGHRIAEVHLHWSSEKGGKHMRDEHAAVSSLKQLELFRGVKQIKRIPLIFEHGLSVGEGEIRKEKELVEGFLEKL